MVRLLAGGGARQEVSQEDAEDAVDLMKHCLLDRLVDETGVVDFRRASGSSKQARACNRMHASCALLEGAPWAWCSATCFGQIAEEHVVSMHACSLRAP